MKDVDASALVGRVGELQEQLLQSQKENMELRFELEQAVTNVPRMKVRMPLFVPGKVCVCACMCMSVGCVAGVLCYSK